MHALVRARIPYLPMEVDDIDDKANRRTLILPNVGAMSDAQSAAMRRFVESGGSLVATGETGRYDQNGDARADFALADLFACHVDAGSRRPGTARARHGPAPAGGAAFAPSPSGHTYLRLLPELRGRVDGPRAGETSLPRRAQRHPVLRGFEETDIIAFGGALEAVRVAAGGDGAG